MKNNTGFASPIVEHQKFLRITSSQFNINKYMIGNMKYVQI